MEKNNGIPAYRARRDSRGRFIMDPDDIAREYALAIKLHAEYRQRGGDLGLAEFVCRGWKPGAWIVRATLLRRGGGAWLS